MQSCRLESAADVRDICHCVQVAEYSVAIHEDDIGIAGVALGDAPKLERAVTGPALDRVKVRIAHFVWGDDESRIGNFIAYA